MLRGVRGRRKDAAHYTKPGARAHGAKIKHSNNEYGIIHGMTKSRNERAVVKTDVAFYIWATDDYAERGKRFCAGDEIRIENGGGHG